MIASGNFADIFGIRKKEIGEILLAKLMTREMLESGSEPANEDEESNSISVMQKNIWAYADRLEDAPSGEYGYNGEGLTTNLDLKPAHPSRYASSQ